MLVSIVIPTFDRAAMLLELLRSIARQTYRPVEAVIVDDASSDGTAAVVQEFFHSGADLSGITLVYERLTARSGAPVARNRGLALASGAAVMFVDSDDLVAPEGLAAAVSGLEADSLLPYVYGKVAIVAGGPETSDWIGCVGQEFPGNLEDIAGYHWHTMGALYRRSFLGQVGPWNEVLSGSQDWEYQARVKLALGSGRFIDVLMGYWRQHKFDRIGATAFRADYVTSVMKACDSILFHARAVGKSDRKLMHKIAQRLFVHAVEWGANGHREERQRCLRQAGASLSGRGGFAVIIRLWLFSPPWADKLALRLWRATRGRT